MSIQIICPNGHRLSVKDSFAGRAGLCPICKARVVVPKPQNGQLSEDEIVDFLSAPPARKTRSSTSTSTTPLAEQEIGQQVATKNNPSPPKKSCTKCNREIAAGTHICPFCRTYIANLRDL